MNTQDACMLLETLMDGIDPITGELLPEDHVCHEPAVLRALHKALTALRDSDDMPGDDAAPVNRNGRLNAGRPWTQQDLDRLKQLYGAGASMEEMCRSLQRRKRGIERQLVYLGLTDRKGETAASESRRSRAGTPWTAEDDKTLWNLWQQGEAEARIAQKLQRSAYAIHCRMEKLGMLNPEDAEAQPLLPPWSLEDVQLLQRLHTSGCTTEEISAQMKRPAASIRARLFYMGLSREAPFSLHD